MNSAELRDRTLCVQCGPNVAVDEDGCCGVCGAQAFGPWADKAVAALERLEALEALMRAEFPTSLIRATIYGSFGLANGVLEEQDYDGNWHEVAWSEDDRRPMEALAELLATYEPIGATPAPAGTQEGEG